MAIPFFGRFRLTEVYALFSGASFYGLSNALLAPTGVVNLHTVVGCFLLLEAQPLTLQKEAFRPVVKRVLL